jgi:hypothetical protein
MDEIFKPEDFLKDRSPELKASPQLNLFVQGARIQAAEDANAKFREWLEGHRIVTGRIDETYRPWSAAGEQKPDDTHTARLVCIEPITEPK